MRIYLILGRTKLIGTYTFFSGINLQLFYKLIWFIAVIVPLVISQQFPGYAVMLAVIFMTYIIGDLIAIPFPIVFAKEAGQ